GLEQPSQAATRRRCRAPRRHRCDGERRVVRRRALGRVGLARPLPEGRAPVRLPRRGDPAGDALGQPRGRPGGHLARGPGRGLLRPLVGSDHPLADVLAAV
ncbi:MAG: hypothetical protein AVDCRST_MAG54-815, partial [uncultured Actinomycetospora sp.]